MYTIWRKESNLLPQNWLYNLCDIISYPRPIVYIIIPFVFIQEKKKWIFVFICWGIFLQSKQTIFAHSGGEDDKETSLVSNDVVSGGRGVIGHA